MSELTPADVAIVGGGPAGVAAACTVARIMGANRRVVLLDNMPALGGNIWRGDAARKPNAARWLKRLSVSPVEVINGATVFRASAADRLIQAELAGESVKEIKWDKLILATGAGELFVPFPGWTLPNVLGCGGLQALAKGGWPVAGKRVVVAGTGPLLLAAAAQFQQDGAHVVQILEQAPMGRLMGFATRLALLSPGKILQALGFKWTLMGVPFKTGCWVSEARGNGRVEAVTATDGRKSWEVACDYLACGYSLIPSLELPAMLGCGVEGSGVTTRVKVDEFQETTVAGVYAAGEPNGIGGMDMALVEGQIAGYAAAGAADRVGALMAAARRGRRFRQALAEAFVLREELKHLAGPETLVCRCEDVTRQRLEAYAGNGAGGWRAAKLQTRCGMGPCQGRICGGAARVLFGWEAPVQCGGGGAGVRPPVLPVRVESLMGGEP